MECLSGIWVEVSGQKSSRTWVFVRFSTLVFPFYKMIFMKRFEFFLFHWFFLWTVKTRDGILGHQFENILEIFCSAIHIPFYWWICQKNILYSGFKNTYKNNPRNKKTRVFSWIAFCRMEKFGWKTRQKSSLSRLEILALKMLFKNSVSD
jgi:hypothetical protein